MASEALEHDLSSSARLAADFTAGGVETGAPPPALADATAMGYEAAHPALQAPLWTEAMHAASRSLR